jgi:uncharacterized protein DUF3606
MRPPKPRYFRNRLDLADRVQIRVLRKRLRVSETELTQVASKVGNSISAISKEVNLQRLDQIST